MIEELKDREEFGASSVAIKDRSKGTRTQTEETR